MVDHGMYHRTVRKLIYLSHARPYIVCAVSVVNQFMHATVKSHLDVVCRIIIYMKGTLGRDPLFQKTNGLRLKAYTMLIRLEP